MKLLREWWSQRKQRQAASDWTTIDVDGGGRVMLDREMVDYMRSKAPPPTQQSLDSMLERARAFRVIEGGVSGGQPRGNKILLEGRDDPTLTGLRQHLRIVDGPAGHCMCYGDPAIEFLDEAGNRLAAIGVHHGRAVRWSGWHEDAALVNGYSLLEWLAGRGVHYPLEQYRAAEQAQVVAGAARERWLAAAPPCLQTLLADRVGTIGMVLAVPSAGTKPAIFPSKGRTIPPTVDAEQWLSIGQALQATYPDGVQRAQVLFLWFGQGSGPWSGFPGYEAIAEELLMDVSINDVLRALEGPELPRPLLEGAARFLGGWSFATRRGTELKSLPTALRRQLLECGLDTSDADRRARAMVAFQGGAEKMARGEETDSPGSNSR